MRGKDDLGRPLGQCGPDQQTARPNITLQESIEAIHKAKGLLRKKIPESTRSSKSSETLLQSPCTSSEPTTPAGLGHHPNHPSVLTSHPCHSCVCRPVTCRPSVASVLPVCLGSVMTPCCPSPYPRISMVAVPSLASPTMAPLPIPMTVPRASVPSSPVAPAPPPDQQPLPSPLSTLCLPWKMSLSPEHCRWRAVS